KDLLFGECIIRRKIENTLLELFKSRGYSEMITPGLEFYDVFTLIHVTSHRRTSTSSQTARDDSL
ncbi:MAG TPA: hypothetical protein PLS20_13425, partial [Ruminococcus flavefaciens]|nr:hypothetical protein [Ruminococcus flavefaciens]